MILVVEEIHVDCRWCVVETDVCVVVGALAGMVETERSTCHCEMFEHWLIVCTAEVPGESVSGRRNLVVWG